MKIYTIGEVARMAKMSTKTILRWEKLGRISKAPRDWRGWRIYTHSALNEILSIRLDIGFPETREEEIHG